MVQAVFMIGFMMAVVAMTARNAIVGRPGGIEAWRAQRKHRRMASMPIAVLPELELGRIVGCVIPSERTPRAPLTGRPCVQLAPKFDHSEQTGWFRIATREQHALLARHGLRPPC